MSGKFDNPVSRRQILTKAFIEDALSEYLKLAVINPELNYQCSINPPLPVLCPHNTSNATCKVCNPPKL